MSRQPTTTLALSQNAFAITAATYNSFGVATNLIFTPTSYILSSLDTTQWFAASSGVCDNSPFTFIPVTQTKTSFHFIAGAAITFAITPFSPTLNCGTWTVTLVYSGTLNDYTGLPSWITINSATGSIVLSTSSAVGTYAILVFGELPNY